MNVILMSSTLFKHEFPHIHWEVRNIIFKNWPAGMGYIYIYIDKYYIYIYSIYPGGYLYFEIG